MPGDLPIDPQKPLPRHVAIIMDGNGRWAQQHGYAARLQGHRAGVESVKAVLRACQELRIRYLTLFAFSTENWKRPKDEVDGLMRLLRDFLVENMGELVEKGVRLRAIGHLQDLPDPTRHALEEAIERSRQNMALDLILALSYGARQEIVDAARRIAEDVQRGLLRPSEITEQTIQARLYAPDVPDPDLLIRTSGELRVSNFLLWQISYAELYITPVLWPDFREPHFYEAVRAFQGRQRRFGNVGPA
ncbi:MAG: isoprenyl transferase [bacterium]|nr:isoprenyl transferase [bacterium]